MKTRFTVILLLITITSYAKIWRINNTGASADFTNLEAAALSASVINGDTLHIEPSSVSYGDALIYKKLTLIGNGYFLAQNSGLKENSLTSKIGILTIATEEVVITGLDVYTIRINAGNLQVKRNLIETIDLMNGTAISNVLLIQNYIKNVITFSERQISNLLISNNYIARGFQYSATNMSGTISNNIIITTQEVNISGFLVKNNIISGSYIFSGTNTYFNNICEHGHVPAGNGNQLNVNISTLYAGGGSPDGQYMLSESSVARGAGYDGEDCGIFGGPDAYVLSGIPNVPSIQYLNVPASSEGNTLNVIISVKSNQ